VLSKFKKDELIVCNISQNYHLIDGLISGESDDFLRVGFLEESLVKKSVALLSNMLNQFYALMTKTLVGGCKIHSLHKFSALDANVSQRAE
jgi:hypothetical protein